MMNCYKSHTNLQLNQFRRSYFAKYFLVSVPDSKNFFLRQKLIKFHPRNVAQREQKTDLVKREAPNYHQTVNKYSIQ